MIEIIVIVAMLSVVISILAPSVLGFLEFGRQKNRMNIARTIYLAAQNQLTELRVMKNLRAEITGGYYKDEAVNGRYELKEGILEAPTNVYSKLGQSQFPQSEIDNGNERYIHFMKKDKGVLDPDHPVIKLLSPIILDREILNDSILIEYNIKTGIVLSAFYGDAIDGFTYAGIENNSVMGNRGMGFGGYQYAALRRQGYYGVTYTGDSSSDSNSPDDLSESITINVYDSYSRRLPEEISSHEYKNVLYAKILMPEAILNDNLFELGINGITVESNVSLDGLNPVGNISTALSAYSSHSNTALIYRHDGNINIDSEGMFVPADQRLACIIWVIDYVGGDMTNVGVINNRRHSIGAKYVETNKIYFDGNSNLSVEIKIQDEEVLATSQTKAHPYFYTDEVEYNGKYTIKSARHLYNINYIHEGTFTQAEDIDLDFGLNRVTNFQPISEFRGNYVAMGRSIENLKIDIENGENVGLFADITGEMNPSGIGYQYASVIGLTLGNPDVRGKNNVGSLCGKLDGFITGIYVRYDTSSEPTPSDIKMIEGERNVGGIVGENKGMIADSTFISPTASRHIDGSISDKSTIGGIVGMNRADALIRRILFLALAPKNGSEINPIVGTNQAVEGNLNKLYYLYGNAIRPSSIASNQYNMEDSNGIGIAMGTNQLYFETISDEWIRKDIVLNEAEMLSSNNTIYPYLYPVYSSEQIALYPNWPITEVGGEISINNIVYYERYIDNTYGAWFIDESDTINNNLSDDKIIAEAGYAIVLLENLNGIHYFFARDSEATGEWKSEDQIVELELKNDSQFAEAISSAMQRLGLWVFTLPLDELSAIQNKSKPLQIMHSLSGEVISPREINGYLQPLFAKGLYKRNQYVAPNPTEFYIRTPWQMKNISVLTDGSTNYTLGKTFWQELNLNFENTGIGVNVDKIPTTYADLTHSAVTGEFLGVYEGSNNIIENVIINNLNLENIALFSVNKGSIQNLTLSNSNFRGGNNVGGIAGSNIGDGVPDSVRGLISGVAVENSEMFSAQYNTGGVAGISSGAINEIIIKDSSIINGNSQAGGVVGVNSDVISNISIENTTVTSVNSRAGGVAGDSSGAISVIKILNSTVSSKTAVGGVAGNGSVVISDCEIENITVSGNSDVGGVIGISSGSISKISIKGSSSVIGSGNNVGGVAGANNSSNIGECDITGVDISGNAFIGGIAGTNSGAVSGINIKDSNVTGVDSNIGGIAGINNNTATITDSSVTNVGVTGSLNIGGIAGNNSGSIIRAGVQHSTVLKNGYADISSDVPINSVGGVAGYNLNGGIVDNVYFLSVKSVNEEPISNSGGGIVGVNLATVKHALYLAHAPRAVSDNVTTIYPIVRSGIDGEKTANDKETCFYLAGNRYSLNEGINWNNQSYNYVYNVSSSGMSVQSSGGGKGLNSKFIDKEWLNFAYELDFTGWFQPSDGYPYPMINNFATPLRWAEADSPVRPDQVDREDWAETKPISDTPGSIRFINGDFQSPLMNPNNSDETYVVLTNNSNPTTWNNPGNPPCIDDGRDHGRFYAYYNHSWVQGWNTRPVYSNDYNNPRWNAIEFQGPNNSATNGRVRRNYDGSQSGFYAELNADVQGTLYQICATVPGTELYYSFYHARRHDNGFQMMNFYLSGMNNDNGEWVYSDGTGRPTLIRPCITPRGNGLSSTATRNTIVYGNPNSDETSISPAKVNFYDPKTRNMRNAYLIDVWVSGLGYGITFWSDTLPNGSNSPIGTSTNQIPIGGVINTTTAKTSNNQSFLPLGLLNAARDNIIGYWHVAQFGSNQHSEWKQYYGLYTVPEDQRTTEFAYESASVRNSREGNYLTGITFKSPGFLSIEKYARIDGSEVKFVQPNDTINIELRIKNSGEVAVGNIVIEDLISPFNEYIDYSGNVVVRKGDDRIDSSLITITEPNVSNNHLLTIKLSDSGNDAVTLSTNEELTVTFDIEIKNEVIEGVSTLLYYFRNQATISYRDVAFVDYIGNIAGYSEADKVKWNASGPSPIQIFIDPITLTKTVENMNPPSDEPPIDGPFKVELKVENVLDSSNIFTRGLINDLIPADFELFDTGTLPLDDITKVMNPDGSTRLTIRNVNLDMSMREKSYTYYLKLRENSNSYGVLYTSVVDDYKYLYNNDDDGMSDLNVMLEFPQTVVGIKPKIENRRFTVHGTDTRTFEIIDINDFEDNRFSDDNYNVTPEIVLLDSDGNLAPKNPNGDYQISNENEFYTAILLRSTNELLFIPQDAALGNEYKFYYQIELTAKKPGGTPEEFNLSSTPAEIVVEVIDPR